MAVDICHKGQHEFLFFGHVAHGILVPQPGIKLTTLTVKAQSLNHWTNREIPWIFEDRIKMHISWKLVWSVPDDFVL